MKTNLLPPNNFIESFIIDHEKKVGDNIQVIADLVSIEHPIETIINARHFITEVLHQGYPDYWNTPACEKIRQSGGKPSFIYSEWIKDFKDQNLIERIIDSNTTVDTRYNSKGEMDLHEEVDKESATYAVSLLFDKNVRYDSMFDRVKVCVVLGQIYVILDWATRFAKSHKYAIDTFMVNIYHKLAFWIHPWWDDCNGWNESSWFQDNKDISIRERNGMLDDMSKTQQMKYISSLDCMNRLHLGFDPLDSGNLKQKVPDSVFQEARKKFEKRKPAHVDNNLMNEVTEILEGINKGAGIGVGCVATFMSGMPKQVKSTEMVDGNQVIKYRNAKSDVAYKAIARECDESLVPTGSTVRNGKKGVEKPLFQCHTKVQEFIKLWPKNTLSEHDWFEKPIKGKKPKKQKYWFTHGATNDKANGKKVAKWLIENMTTEVIEKFVREWKRVTQKAA